MLLLRVGPDSANGRSCAQLTMGSSVQDKANNILFSHCLRQRLQSIVSRLLGPGRLAVQAVAACFKELEKPGISTKR